MSGQAVYRIASTRYSRWIKVECVQMCGWQPSKSATSEAVKHTKTTGHETAVSYIDSIHYHQRREDEPRAAAPAEAREEREAAERRAIEGDFPENAIHQQDTDRAGGRG